MEANAPNQRFKYKTSEKDNYNGPTLGAGGGSFQFDKGQMEAASTIYRTPRSQAYLDVIAVIDLLSATDEEIIEKLKEVVDEDILEEFVSMSPEEIIEELRLCFQEEIEGRELKLKDAPEPDVLEAVISKCYISGCDIHSIDRRGNIMEHYTSGQQLSEHLLAARSLFHQHENDCSCIEIYNSCLRLIKVDCSVEEFFYE